jgi:Flp pilus assembly protein TadG
MRNTKWVSGQGLVEFALVLPILLLLVVGALDLGRAFYLKVALENSAREGAYYMVYNPAEGAANAFAKAKLATQVEAEDSGITIPTEDIEVQCMQGATIDNTCPSGSTVTVTVRHELELVIDMFSDGPVEMINDARMLIP